MSSHNSIASRDFSKVTLRNLSRKGIAVVGKFLAPDPAAAMPTAEGIVCYELSNNGEWQGRTHSQVVHLAR